MPGHRRDQHVRRGAVPGDGVPRDPRAAGHVAQRPGRALPPPCPCPLPPPPGPPRPPGAARRYGLDPEEWSAPGQEFGAIPLIIHLGDFLQLRPFTMGLADSDARVRKLSTWKNKPSANAQAARKMFLHYEDTFILEGNKRFRDHDLPTLLDSIRRRQKVSERQNRERPTERATCHTRTT